jgi:polo-like kinase 1
MEDDAYLCDRAGSKKYRRKKLLGTGGFAKCFEVEKLDDHQTYAAKVIPKKSINEKRQRYKLLLEIKLHKSLVHEGIVGFRDVFEDAENIYIILEYCPMDTLKKLVKRRKRLTEFEVKVYTLQMVRAVMFIHQHNVIHRDLKLGNILISEDMHIKICDFGLSTRIRSVGEKRKTVCGTPNYIAPEVLEEQGHSYEVDIWSLGVIIYTLLVGKPPYEDDSVESTYDNIRNNRYSFPNLDISEQARDLIEKILVLEPDRRLSLEDILSHEFLQPLESL